MLLHVLFAVNGIIWNIFSRYGAYENSDRVYLSVAETTLQVL